MEHPFNDEGEPKDAKPRRLSDELKIPSAVDRFKSLNLKEKKPKLPIEISAPKTPLNNELNVGREDVISNSPQVTRRKRKNKKKPSRSQLGQEAALEVEKLFPEVEISEVQIDVNTDFQESQESEEIDHEFSCINARTAIILPFVYRNGSRTDSVSPSMITQRKCLFSQLRGEDSSLWIPSEIEYKEVNDLSPHFRQMLGSKGSKAEKTWASYRFRLNKNALTDLFSDAKIHSVQASETKSYPMEVEKVEITLYPRGASLLVFHVNWLKPGREEKITLNDVRTLVFISRYKHIVPGVTDGWQINATRLTSDNQEIAQLRDFLGNELYDAQYNGVPVPLVSIAQWLLCIKDENVNDCPNRLDQSRHAYHHSTVVIDEKPPKDILFEYLFHLRRAFGQKNRPPPNSSGVLGKVLVWRINKYIGISREGSVSLSWPTNSTWSSEFERAQWHMKFQGKIDFFTSSDFGEELSDLASSQAENLVMESSDLDIMLQQRNKLRELASIMTRYTLSMSSNDCGGPSEYSEFFITLREVCGIPELREELSGELKDVLAVVESNYLEEERRKREMQEEARRDKEETQKEHKQRKDDSTNRNQIIISLLGALSLPYVVVAGLFGMNVMGIPDVRFWVLVVATSAGSVFLAIAVVVFVFLRRRYHRKAKELSDAKEVHSV